MVQHIFYNWACLKSKKTYDFKTCLDIRAHNKIAMYCIDLKKRQLKAYRVSYSPRQTIELCNIQSVQSILSNQSPQVIYISIFYFTPSFVQRRGLQNLISSVDPIQCITDCSSLDPFDFITKISPKNLDWSDQSREVSEIRD